MVQVNHSLRTRLVLGAALFLPPPAFTEAAFSPADSQGQQSITMPQAPKLPIGELFPPAQRLNISEQGDELLSIRDALTRDTLVIPRDLLIRPSQPPRGFRLTTGEVRKFLGAGPTPESYLALLESSPDLSALPVEARRKLIKLLPQIDQQFPSQFRTGFYFFMHGGESVGSAAAPGNRLSDTLSNVFHSVKVACVPLAERLDSSLLSENEWFRFLKTSRLAGGGEDLPHALAVPSDSVTAPTAAFASASAALAMIGATYAAWRGRARLSFWFRRFLGLPPKKEPPGFEIKVS